MLRTKLGFLSGAKEPKVSCSSACRSRALGWGGKDAADGTCGKKQLTIGKHLGNIAPNPKEGQQQEGAWCHSWKGDLPPTPAWKKIGQNLPFGPSQKKKSASTVGGASPGFKA